MPANASMGGIYILISRGSAESSYKPEYRVISASSIRSIFANRPTGPIDLDLTPLPPPPRNIRVFTDPAVAEGYALAVYDRWMEPDSSIDFKIQVVDYSHIAFPSDLS